MVLRQESARKWVKEEGGKEKSCSQCLWYKLEGGFLVYVFVNAAALLLILTANVVVALLIKTLHRELQFH